MSWLRLSWPGLLRTFFPWSLTLHRDAHAAGCAFDGLYRRLEAAGRKVGHLELRNVLYLLLRDLGYLRLVGLLRAFLDAGCLEEKHSGRGGLGYERERPV